MDQTAMPIQGSDVINHLSHVDYPASKQDLMDACEKMSEVPEKDKEWFIKALPEKTYSSVEEVKRALGFEM